MKKIVLIIVTLILVCPLLCACKKHADTPEAEFECSSRHVDLSDTKATPSAERISELSSVVSRDLSEFSDEEKELIYAADECMKSKFGFTDLSSLEVDIRTSKKNPKANYVKYVFCVYGYTTNESYHIYFSEDKAIDTERATAVNGQHISKAVLPSAQDVAAAEEAIRSASGENRFFMVPRKEGLVLCTEVIEANGEGHVHVDYFFKLCDLYE